MMCNVVLFESAPSLTHVFCSYPHVHIIYHTGRSTYSQIKIYEREERPIMLEIYGDNVTVPNIQDRMTSSGSSSYVQDSLDHDMSVSLDGKTITAYGNSWRRWKLPDVVEVTKSTMMSFKANVVKEEENHMICLLRDTHNANDGRNDCFAIAGKQVTGNTGSYRDIKPHAKEEDGPTEYQILVGSHFTGAVHYIGIAQDNDKVSGTYFVLIRANYDMFSHLY